MSMQIVLLALSTVLAVVWAILCEKGYKRYQGYLAPLADNNSHPFYQVYGVGFYLLELIRYKYDTPMDRKRITQTKIIFGEKYGEYFYRVNMAQKISLAYLVLVAFLCLGAVTGEAAMLLAAVIGAVVAYLFVDSEITDVMNKRNDEIDRTFAEMISKLTLLINAGMIMREAWSEVAYGSEGLLYDEMRTVIQLMQNGMPETDAYIHFGNRCGSKRVRKFASMLVQNLTKGNRELVDFLKQNTKESWEERKNYVKRQGEAAATKLMLPIGIMFAGIIIMIVVPIFGNMSAM